MTPTEWRGWIEGRERVKTMVIIIEPVLLGLGKSTSKFTLVTPNYSILFMLNIVGHTIND